VSRPARTDWLIAAVMGLVAVPAAVVLHEAGHVAGFQAFGLDAPSLHYAYSGFAGQRDFWDLLREGDRAGAARLAPVVPAGLSTLFGLIVSYAMIALGTWGVAQFHSAAFVAVALSAAARFPPVLVLALLGRAEHTDEAHLSLTLGVPPAAPIVLGLAALGVATVGIGWLLRRRGRTHLMAPALLGVVAGTGVWMGWLGRAVLP
jgi:hypothetical protein